MSFQTINRRSAPGILLLALSLAACSTEPGGEKSQVVATVNDSEITISQLRATLLARGETEASIDTTRRTLEGLVNEQLLVEAALRNELDRDPAVVQAFEAARRQILANVFVERLVYPHDEVSAAEQTAYFREHPELFAKRQIYQLATFTCPGPSLADDVVVALDGAATVADLNGVLEANQLECTVQPTTRAAEQLALSQLGEFASAAIGDVIIQPQDDATVLMLITGVQDSPLALEQAQPIIQQYLANVRNARALDTYLKEARAAAEVMHVDDTLFAASNEAQVIAPEPVATPAADTGAAILN